MLVALRVSPLQLLSGYPRNSVRKFFFGADRYLSSLLTSVAGLGEGSSTSIARYGVGEKQFEICSISRPKDGLCQGGTSLCPKSSEDNTKLISFVGLRLQQRRQ